MAVKKEVVETVAVVGLAAVLAGALFMGRLSVIGLFKSSPSPAATRRAGSEPAKVPAAQVIPDEVLPNASKYYTAGMLRDPLKSFLPQPPTSRDAARSQIGTPDVSAPPVGPAMPKPLQRPTLNIQGLIWGGPRPQAIINNHVYSVDDTVAGGTITSISPRGVELDYHGTTVLFSRASSPKGQEGRQFSQGGGDGPK